MEYFGGDDDANFDDDPELMRELMAIQKEEQKRKERAKKTAAAAASKSKGGHAAPTLGEVDDDIDDDDLEAELNALLAAEGPAPKHAKQHHVAPPMDHEMAEDLPTSSSTAHEISAGSPVEQKAPARPEAPMVAKQSGGPPPLPPRGSTGGAATPADPTPPPPVPRHTPAPPAAEPPAPAVAAKPQEEDVKTKARELLTRRLQAYARNAKLALEDKNTEYAKECAETVEMFEQALEACNEQDITMEDLAEIPSTPPPYKKKLSPVGPLNTLEDELLARIKRFGELGADFEQKGDVSRARMQKRLADQLKTALVIHRKGRPLQEPEKLPVPLGFAPLKPTAGAAPAGGGAASPAAPATLPVPTAQPAAARSKTPSPAPSEPTPQEQSEIMAGKVLEYKKAAVLAKKKGDLPAAAKYLQAAKLLEKELASGPKAKAPGPSTSAAAAAPAPHPSGGTDQMANASKLEVDLRQQLELIIKLKKQFEAAKDVKRTLFYNELIGRCSANLKTVYAAAKHGDPLMFCKIHQINLPALEINPGLSADVLEVKIKSIANLKLPDGWKPTDAYTFVTYEFPFPHDSHQTGKTKTITGTDQPVFDEAFQLPINRKTRQLQRIVQRSPLKLAVFQKGGFLRSDKPCGEASILLGGLVNQATLTIEQDLLIQRKKTGGPYPWIQLDEKSTLL
ncbi:C2 domain-containing protein [Aphelenchoides fujianensis]|nr:C2 domain-containing protein [Aphelenchoides fujianensis]